MEVAIAHSCEEHRHTRRSSARMEWTRAQVANVCGMTWEANVTQAGVMILPHLSQ